MNESATTIEPVKKRIVVALDRERAFELFTAGVDTWWPLVTHSVAGERALTCRFEAGIGGRIYEVDNAGDEHEWGRVLEWDPPRRVVFSWYPGRTDVSAQEVEVRFEDAQPEGTIVLLEHRGWETLGDRAVEVRTSYMDGWDLVLGRMAEVAQTG